MIMTIHAAERYYERILEEPVPKKINMQSELVLKVEEDIIRAYNKYKKITPILSGTITVDIRNEYRAVIINEKIVTVNKNKKKKLTPAVQASRKEHINGIRKPHGYKFGKKVYGHKKTKRK